MFWKVNVLDKFGGSNIQWGLSESPLVLSDRILVSPGGRGASIVALKKTDGSLLWKSLGDEAGYSSAVLHEAGGIREAIYFTAERALGIDVSIASLARLRRELLAFLRAALSPIGASAPPPVTLDR